MLIAGDQVNTALIKALTRAVTEGIQAGMQGVTQGIQAAVQAIHTLEEAIFSPMKMSDVSESLANDVLQALGIKFTFQVGRMHPTNNQQTS
jgi:hypothetical protein